MRKEDAQRKKKVVFIFFMKRLREKDAQGERRVIFIFLRVGKEDAHLWVWVTFDTPDVRLVALPFKQSLQVYIN